MSSEKKIKKKKNKTGLFILLCVGAFIVSFAGSAAFKLTYAAPALKKYTVDWNDETGTIRTDLSYGDSDADMLKWLASKGYVAAGINYTLRDERHPQASVYSQSAEIKSSIPAVVEEAGKLGYDLDSMAISGGSAGGTLAMLYAYRDAAESPIPVKMMFEAVGPSSFYPEDWSVYGLDQNPEAAAGLFSVMSGSEITADMFGTEAYEEAIKPISAYMWVDENSVPSVIAYGVYDKVSPFDAAKHLIEALEKK